MTVKKYAPKTQCCSRARCFIRVTSRDQLSRDASWSNRKLCFSTGYHRILRSDEGLTLETSALYSLQWPIYIFNLVDITISPKRFPLYVHVLSPPRACLGAKNDNPLYFHPGIVFVLDTYDLMTGTLPASCTWYC